MPKKSKSKKSEKSDKKSKKSKKSSKKDIKASSSTMKAVMKLVDKKPAHYAKRDLLRKLKDDHEKQDVRDAITVLWAKGTLRKKEGKYVHNEKEAA